MATILRVAVAMAALLGGVAPAAQPVAPPAAPPARVVTRLADAVARTDARLERLRQETGIPALQAAVLVDGAIVYSKALGLADVASEAPATTQTRFRIASISKAITGAALARMASRGDINLDAPLAGFVPDLPEAWRSITCRELASHTSGIRHYRVMEIWNQRHYRSLREALGIFRDDPLLFEPGATRKYSTYGFTLLGVAMESAAGRPFDQIVRTEVTQPLEMTRTVVDDAQSPPPDVATSYLLTADRQAVVAPPTDHSYKVPGGGILSTAEDLVRLGWAVVEPGVLDDAALAMLRTPISTSDGRTHPYSLGWNVVGTSGIDLRLSHGGSQPGSRCFLLASCEDRVVVAILCSVQAAPITAGEAERIARLFVAEGP